MTDNKNEIIELTEKQELTEDQLDIVVGGSVLDAQDNRAQKPDLRAQTSNMPNIYADLMAQMKCDSTKKKPVEIWLWTAD